MAIPDHGFRGPPWAGREQGPIYGPQSWWMDDRRTRMEVKHQRILAHCLSFMCSFPIQRVMSILLIQKTGLRRSRGPVQVQTWLGVRMHYGHPDFVVRTA